ncbi:hypothetical protein BD324DRAFT_629315 [Kockovaella imperatae]|uniref:Uncharacterized protein n=1 Tax=Kockovaella imperatae TaxID=4999 RepID=A0A1Y1UEB2_9TREE|nr:hypothetical protein BD324DRAFT_629315 [Kockovaella imperatae]ORX35867.1 hypothetical protein BD324DRAFT_629315 [Kockovaella imperatae]
MDSTFAVPALPRREGHGSRPLSMSKTQNLSGSPLTSDHHHPEAKQVNNSGANRLKRLSLVARPPIREAPASPQRAPGHTNTTPSTPGPQPAGGPSHRRAMGMRSSISYSPALARREASSHEETRSEFETWAEERGYFGEMIAGPSRSSGKRSSVQSLEGSCPEAKNKDDDRRGETFVERHADLLTLIAQKERRVNDLRQELASQEASLNQLKTRWTAIISKSAPPAPSRPVRAGHHPLSGTSTIRPSPIEPPQTLAADPGPAAEHATGTNSTALTPSDGQSLASFITSLGTTPEGLLGQDTIEGGKRFWTQLVKTVSAAAGGTVPDAQSPQPSKVDM